MNKTLFFFFIAVTGAFAGRPVNSPSVVTVAEVQAPFWAGNIKAHPTQNTVYLIDGTARRVLAIDTAAGRIAAAAALEESEQQAADPNYFYSAAELTLSFDMTKLYVALPAAHKIQVFSLPDLAPLITLPVIFPPWGLAATAGDRLYVTADHAADGNSFAPLREVSVTNGSTLQSMDSAAPWYGSFHEHTLLRTDSAGTRLYASETGLTVVGGPGYMFEYDVTVPTPALVHAHPFDMEFLADFAVDEQRGRLYTLNGGIYGIGLTDMSTDANGGLWSFGTPYAAAVTFLPSDTSIYGASYEEVRKFRRSDGAVLATWVVSHGDGIYIQPHRLAITPNGRLIYVRQWNTSYVGLIGTNPSITVTNPPANGGPASAILSATNFADNGGNNDGAPNAGEIITLSPTFTNPGTSSATNMSMDVAVSSGGTLLSASSQAYGNIPPGSSGTLGPVQIQLDPTLPHRSTVTVSFTAHWGSGQSKIFPYTLVIRHPYPPQTTAIARSGSDIVVTFNGVGGETYRLEYSDSLISPNWSGVNRDLVAETDGPNQLTDQYGVGRGHGFYRVRWLP